MIPRVGFRDDHLATRARADALEQELAQARDELAAERASGATVAAARPTRVPAVLAGGSLVLFALAYVSAYMVSGYEAEVVGVTLAVAGAVVACLAVSVLLIAQLLVVVPPNQVAILSGRSHRAPDGSVLGFRIVRGGRVLRMPIIEALHFMDLSNMPIELELGDCHSKSGRLAIRAIANTKIAGDMPHVVHAIERFLGRDRADVALVARQTLEGALRGVVAAISLEEARDDPTRLASMVAAEAESDLQKLGLVLDTLTITRVDAS